MSGKRIIVFVEQCRQFHPSANSLSALSQSNSSYLISVERMSSTTHNGNGELFISSTIRPLPKNNRFRTVDSNYQKPSKSASFKPQFLRGFWTPSEFL
jgi:hypothetical protein